MMCVRPDVSPVSTHTPSDWRGRGSGYQRRTHTRSLTLLFAVLFLSPTSSSPCPWFTGVPFLTFELQSGLPDDRTFVCCNVCLTTYAWRIMKRTRRVPLKEHERRKTRRDACLRPLLLSCIQMRAHVKNRDFSFLVNWKQPLILSSCRPSRTLSLLVPGNMNEMAVLSCSRRQTHVCRNFS